jgi:hypothetical protein
MKNLFLILLAIGLSVAGYSQTYNPSLSVPVNKAVGISQASPTDARSYFYDATNFVYRPYTSTSEVLSYLNLAKYRTGQFDIVVNTGGSLASGVITGGTNAIYYFKNGTSNSDLVLKETVHSVNGQVGVVVAKNADSLRGQVLDTTVRRNNYVITYDSTNRKYYLAAGGSGTTYTAGTGIDITGSVIAAQTTTALWNASQLRGRAISTTAPTSGQVLKWDGSAYTPAADNSAIDTAYFSNDTLFFVSGTDTSRVHLALVPVTDNCGTQTVVTDTLTGIYGVGIDTDPIRNDTNIVATKAIVRHITDSLADVGASGMTEVLHDTTLNGRGISGDSLKVDTLVVSTKKNAQHLIDSLAAAGFVADGSETIVTAGVSIGVSGTGTAADPYVITNTATDSAGSNPLNALSILDYGGVADATTPSSGNNANGTNNTPALNAMFAAAASGQLCIVPNGNWLFSTAADTIDGPNRINLLVLGNTYHNGSDWLIFANASGAFEQHTVVHLGLCFGRINMTSHSRTTYDNGTKPNWGTFSGTPFKIYNNYQTYIKFNFIEGFLNAVEIIGNDYDDASRGSQENTIVGRKIQRCANGFTLTSLNGRSYCDKNVFTGWDDGTIRVSAGLGIKIDGYSGTSPDGEVYDGAFRSNKFHLLIENVDSIAECHGDITETKFDVTVEGSGVFGSVGWRMRIASPNYVRAPVYNGRGIFAATWCDDGMGRNAVIQVPIWTSVDAVIGTTNWGNYAITDDAGALIIMRSLAGLTKVKRDTGFARHGFRFLDFGSEERDTTVTSSTYTIGAKYRYVEFSSGGGTITLPTVTSAVGRVITIRNTNASSAITVANVFSGDQTSIPAGKVMTYRCNGSNWKSIINPEGTGSGGSSQWTTSGSYIYYNNNIAVGNTSPHQYAFIQSQSNTTKAIFEFNTTSSYVSTPRNGSLDYNGVDLRFTSSSVPQKILTDYNTATLLNKTWQGLDIDIQYWSTSGGSARQIPRVNAAEDEMEFADPNYELLYQNTSDIDIQNTTASTSLHDGSGTLTPVDAPSGSEYVFRAAGAVYTSTTTQQFTVVFNTGAGTRSFTRTLPANLSGAAFELEFTESFVVGSSYRYSLKMIIDNNGTPYTVMNSSFASSSWSMTSNKTATFAWLSASTANRLRVFMGKWEIKRRQ